MDRYQKAEKPKVDTPIDENEIRITSQRRMRSYISYAMSLLQGNAREALWLRMSGCMDQLHAIVLAVWHLQRVLSKKRDPFTHVLLLDEVMEGNHIGHCQAL